MKMVKLMMAMLLSGLVFLSGGAKDLLGKAANAHTGAHEGSTHDGASTR
jgi:hypothetical protein